ncbi:dTDP-4-amino-4,6-dideoxy-D-galactose acyltransferase [Glaesserella australis]|uniref:dTDP-4-amino-4,6-dideoxy-D-galactose acyltransferase n=2 Tax=Pasteurellaceae TaxID=712 RepID=A0A328BX34_9PAST|nr:dTDP-4-amino-4,6-dideoxy-D-galactose acyltransferase [Glaesserella sp. 15-184]RAL18888.1 dTDP-4-amino-4,6-dideoxy-D-galactose acyltransferase [Glaesserella australis]
MKMDMNIWLSHFFCRKIAELTPSCDQLDNLVLTDFDLVQAKLASTEVEKICLLQQQGFQFVEGEIRFVCDLANFSSDMTACRPARLDDLAKMEGFSHQFAHTRFRSPWFSAKENQRFYRQWFENAIKGEFDDICLVCETENGDIQGAISVRLSGKIAQVGLIAVAEQWQGQGIGKRLLSAAMRWAKSQQAETLEIATQSSNLKAIRLYQSIGATICGIYYWFYWQTT